VCEKFENESQNEHCIKTLNFLNSSSLNHHEFVALLEETEIEYGEIIYPSNVTWLISGSVLKQFF
jgi:glucose uptake protein GlcU